VPQEERLHAMLCWHWSNIIVSFTYYYVYQGSDEEKCLFCDHVGSQHLWNERSDFNYDCLNVKKKMKAYMKEKQNAQKGEKKKKVNFNRANERQVFCRIL